MGGIPPAVIPVVSIPAVPLYNEATFYPNPVSDYLTIEHLNGNGKLMIMNITGQILEEHNFVDEKIILNLASYDSGLYFIYIVDNKGIGKSFKIIKQN